VLGSFLFFSRSSRQRIRSKLFSAEAWKRFIHRSWNSLRHWPHTQWVRWRALRFSKRAQGAYQFLTDAEVCSSRSSDTLFILGSGPSVKLLTSEEINYMSGHDVMGFNWVCRNPRLKCHYYLIKEVVADLPFAGHEALWDQELLHFAERLRQVETPRTVYVVQKGWYSINGNRLLGLRALPNQSKIYHFTVKSRSRFSPPSEQLSDGLVHGNATLLECINFGYAGGWKHIVLVGIDLNDNRYFWDDKAEALFRAMHSPRPPGNPHPTSVLLAEYLTNWKPYFEKKGISIEVYNPQSLLASVLPVFDRSVISRSDRVIS
jgi:hypothetical protein